MKNIQARLVKEDKVTALSSVFAYHHRHQHLPERTLIMR